MRVLLVAVALSFVGVVLVLPLAALLQQAFARGLGAYLESLRDGETWNALRLSLLVAAIVVPINTVIGVAAAWAVTKHDFRGKALLVTLLDVPFSVSPVVAGLLFVLLFGRQGFFGAYLAAHDLKIIFALPGIVLATLFVTFPLVARELIPLMASQGREEELAARVLGASGWRMFWRITLPNIQWGLLYGVIVCTARSLGEFGAVSVVSGHIRGVTSTLPLHIEIRYNEYDFVGAFASASLLTIFALVSLLVKTYVEARDRKVRLSSPTAARASASGTEHGEDPPDAALADPLFGGAHGHPR